MTKIYVYTIKANQKSRRLLWATFRLEIDAHRYADALRKTEPTWKIEVA